MLLEVLKYPHPILAKKSAPVTVFTPELEALARDMAETMYENEGIGLAAPQIGKNIRMVVIDLSGPSERSGAKAYINPVLEPLSDEILESEEGCLSVPDYRSNVKRLQRVRVRAQNLKGEHFAEDAEDLLAICLQHECDHLDGRLFLDHISRLKRSLYEGKLKKRLKTEAEKQGKG